MTSLKALWQRMIRIRFMRFAIVGAVGFVVDASILSLILHQIGEHPILGRCASILFAMTATWLGNRSFTFAHPASPSLREWGKYVAVNSVGATINFAVYTVGIWLLPISSLPLKAICALMIATLTAMSFNFLGMKHAVFQPPK